MRKTLNRDLRTRPLHETALPIALDPAVMPGAEVLGTDGRLYASLRWPTSSDPWTWVSTADIATNITADATSSLVKVAPENYEVTVGTGGDFATLVDALQHMATFVPRTGTALTLATIRILAGTVLNQQISLINVNLGWVRITSDDPEVLVDCTGWSLTTPFSTNRFHRHWMFAASSVVPVLATVFRRIGVVPAEGMVFVRLNAATMATFSAETVTDPQTHAYTVGLRDADIGIFLESRSTARLDKMLCDGNSDLALLLSNSEIALTLCRFRGVVTLRVQQGSLIRINNSDFRSVAGVDTAGADMQFGNVGNQVYYESGWGAVPTTVGASLAIVYQNNLPARHGASRFDGPITGVAVTQSTTDATQGRLLRVGDFGIGALEAAVLANIDDGAMAGGVFRTDAATVGTMPPNAASGNGVLLHLRGGPVVDTNRRQIWAASFGVGDDMWHRRRLASGTWTSWRRLYDSANILGAVAQSAGVPTGALRERISNANGRAERDFSGSMECWRENLSAASATIAFGSRFRSADVTWTFPTAFVAGSTPVVVASVIDGDCDVRLLSVSNTQAVFRIVSDVSKASAISFQAEAKGRWSDMT
jgi:hypothetical protein